MSLQCDVPRCLLTQEADARAFHPKRAVALEWRGGE